MSWIDLIGFGEQGRGGILLWATCMTLAVTAAGVPFLGIGAAFWGLVAGLGLYATERAWSRRRG